MPQFNFDAVWSTLTETDKRRIVAIWCCEQPTKVCTIIYQSTFLPADNVASKLDWDFVARATSSAHGGAARKANGKLLAKLRDGGAVEDGNEVRQSSAFHSPPHFCVAQSSSQHTSTNLSQQARWTLYIFDIPSHPATTRPLQSTFHSQCLSTISNRLGRRPQRAITAAS